LPKSAVVIKVISFDWAGVILVRLFLVKFPILAQFPSMLSYHGQLGVAFAFLPPLFPVLLHAYEPYGMQFDYGGLVSMYWAYELSYLSFPYHIPSRYSNTACNGHSNMLRLVKQNLTRCIHTITNSTNP
jgi:hypothetical protein